MNKNFLLPLIMLVPSLINCGRNTPVESLDDKDYDGMVDKDDPKPVCNEFYGMLDTSFGSINGVKFKLDYRNFIDYSNLEYHKDLAILGSIIVNDAPGYGCITINKDDVKYSNTDRGRGRYLVL